MQMSRYNTNHILMSNNNFNIIYAILYIIMDEIKKLSHTRVKIIHDLLCEKYHILFVVFSCQCTFCNLAILNHKWPLMNKGPRVGYV
jgi:hypothetical protein